MDSILKTRKKRNRVKEWIIERLLFLSAIISIFTTVAILFVLLNEAFDFFQQVSPIDFFTGLKWTPLFQPQHFGILPLVWGTILVTIIALAIAVPFGLGSAIFLSEYAPDRLRRTIKPILEILAGIPTVVYGYFVASMR